METVPCDLCGSRDSSPVFKSRDAASGNLFDLVHCRRCGLAYLNPRPDRDEIGRYYSDFFSSAPNKRFSALVEWGVYPSRWLRAKKIMKLKSPGKILDAGCGRGLMLSILKNAGWESYGAELSDATASIARSKGIETHTGDLSGAPYPPDFFDVITMWHSLEHVPHPQDALRAACRLLRSDGILVIEVPNFASWHSKIAKEDCFLVDAPRHFYHFTDSTLSAMLLAAGFKAFKKSTFSLLYDTFGLAQYFLNSAGLKHNFLYDVLRRRSASFLSEHPAHFFLNAAVTFLLLPFFSAASFLFSLAASFLGQGGSLRFYAKKL